MLTASVADRPGARGRRGWQLHRRRVSTDALGEQVSVFDMAHPDVTAAADGPHAVCWQVSGQGRTRGQLSSGAVQAEQGERYREVLQGALFSDLSVNVRDRVVVDGHTYELREVQIWPSYRMLYAQRL